MSISAAAAGMISAGIAGGASLIGGRKSNTANAKEAQKNRDFQEDMSNTSYQRAVKDMRAAGINPMLAAKTGGASTPGGSQAQQSDEISPAVSSALQARQVSAGVEKMDADTSVSHEQANLTREQARQEQLKNDAFEFYINEIKSRTEANTASAGQSRAQTNFINEQVNKVGHEISNIQQNIKESDARINAMAQTIKESNARINAMNVDNDNKLVMREKLRQEIEGILTDNEMKALNYKLESEYGPLDRKFRTEGAEMDVKGKIYDLPRRKKAGEINEGPTGGTLNFLREWGSAVSPFK